MVTPLRWHLDAETCRFCVVYVVSRSESKSIGRLWLSPFRCLCWPVSNPVPTSTDTDTFEKPQTSGFGDSHLPEIRNTITCRSTKFYTESCVLTTVPHIYIIIRISMFFLVFRLIGKTPKTSPIGCITTAAQRRLKSRTFWIFATFLKFTPLLQKYRRRECSRVLSVITVFSTL